jgi:hypothetical protein
MRVRILSGVRTMAEDSRVREVACKVTVSRFDSGLGFDGSPDGLLDGSPDGFLDGSSEGLFRDSPDRPDVLSRARSTRRARCIRWL